MTRLPQMDQEPLRLDAAEMGDVPAGPSRLQQLITWLLVLGLLAAMLLAFASLLERGRATRPEARLLQLVGDAQSLARTLQNAAPSAVAGDEAAFTSIQQAAAELSGVCRPVSGASMLEEAMQQHASQRLDDVRAVCLGVLASAEHLVQARDDILRFYSLAASASGQLCRLATASERAAELLVETDAPAQLVLDTALQVARARRMSSALGALLERGGSGLGSADLGAAVADEIEVALDALRRSPVPGAGEQDALSDRAVAAIAELWPDYRSMRLDADRLFALHGEMQTAFAAGGSARREARQLIQALDGVAQALRGGGRPTSLLGLQSRRESGLLFAGLALVFLGLLGLQQLIRSRRRARISHALNLANRRAIERLLDEMSGLADGDLTVEAEVSSEVTGAIAHSVNDVVEALRGLVATINDTSGRVNDSAQRTRDIARQLAEGSDRQARQIEQSSEAISSMTGAIDSIARDAAESAAVSNRSVEVAGRGARAVHDTIAEMNEIRGRIQETSKRIRRLGDSSQEIGETVELIDDIADQTNILALNAAMQAAMAGEAGRGFAVVADEVQRLAERSRSATKQIDAIVRTIRRDTNEAVRSMDASMGGVDSGAKVAENAGNALREIENVSTYIAELTRRIADCAGHESREALKVNETVKSVLSITQENTRGTRATAEAVEALAALAVELRRSVAGFKLRPDGGD